MFHMIRCLELDDILSSIFASIEASLPETLQVVRLRLTAKDLVTLNFELHHLMNFPSSVAFKVGSSV